MLYTPIQTDSNGREIFTDFDGSFPYTVYTRPCGRYAKDFAPMHWHDAFQFCTAVRGSIVITTENAGCVIKTGQCAFVNSGVVHSTRALDGKSAVYVSHMVLPEFISGGAPVIGQKYIAPLIRCQKIELLRGDKNMAAELARAKELFDIKDDFYEFGIRRIFSLLIAGIISENRTAIDESAGGGAAAAMRTKAMLTCIHERFAEPLTLEDIARSANISVRECSRSFRRATGMSAIEYLLRYRAIRAADMLNETDNTVTEIALACGFSSPAYFTRVFGKIFGTSPSLYRKNGLKY